MPPVGFEPTFSADEWPQIYALDRVVTETDMCNNKCTENNSKTEATERVTINTSCHN